MPEELTQYVIDTLNRQIEMLDQTAIRLEDIALISAQAQSDASKARVGNRLLGAGLLLAGIAIVLALWFGWQANTTANRVEDVQQQQEADRIERALQGCQIRNTAQETGRRSAKIAITEFANGISRYDVDLQPAVDAILDDAVSHLPTFLGIDTDCTTDGYYSLDDYASIAPDELFSGPVSVPPAVDEPGAVPLDPSVSTTTVS